MRFCKNCKTYGCNYIYAINTIKKELILSIEYADAVVINLEKSRIANDIIYIKEEYELGYYGITIDAKYIFEYVEKIKCIDKEFVYFAHNNTADILNAVRAVEHNAHMVRKYATDVAEFTADITTRVTYIEESLILPLVIEVFEGEMTKQVCAQILSVLFDIDYVANYDSLIDMIYKKLFSIRQDCFMRMIDI